MSSSLVFRGTSVLRAPSTLTKNTPIKIIECPRDAMQGLKDFIPTEAKVRYLNALLKCGFDTVDFGSFVSAPAVPQMRDTEEVLKSCDWDSRGDTKLLAVVANTRGAERALMQSSRLNYIGFPLSVSPTFQHKNTNKTIDVAFEQVRDIHNMCTGTNGGHTELLVYLSMAFGNPYGEECTTEAVMAMIDKLHALGTRTVVLADTVGFSTPDNIKALFEAAVPAYPGIEFGAHFHTQPNSGPEKLEAALKAGCRRFDSTIGGLGGCPFAKSTLVGNVSTETVLAVLESAGIDLPPSFNQKAFVAAQHAKHDVLGLGIKELILTQVLNDEYAFIDLCLEKFKAADVRGVGGLSETEFISALTAAYVELGEIVPSEEKMRQSYVRTDLSQDGRITFDEYMAGIRRALKKRLNEMV
eukprot:PhM_4_TR10595/c0_g1_i1/m.67599/K01640/E4.1.3.4, HMGCL, hmgL; hydroxymethylglutaryl-CoA lyase